MSVLTQRIFSKLPNRISTGNMLRTLQPTNHSLQLPSKSSHPKQLMHKVSSQPSKYLPEGLCITNIGNLVKCINIFLSRNKENQWSKLLVTLKTHSYKRTSQRICMGWNYQRLKSNFFMPLSHITCRVLMLLDKDMKLLFTLRHKR